MRTATSAVKSLYVSTRECMPRQSEPAAVRVGDDSSSPYAQDLPWQHDYTTIYRAINFTAILNQKIEVPREGLTTLKLTGVYMDETSRGEGLTTYSRAGAVPTKGGDYYDSTPHNLGFVLTFQMARAYGDTRVPIGKPVDVVIAGFDRSFYTCNGVEVPKMVFDGANITLEADITVSQGVIGSHNEFERSATVNTYICTPPDNTHLGAYLENHKNNLTTRINLFLGSYALDSNKTPLHVLMPQTEWPELFSEKLIRQLLAQLKLHLIYDGEGQLQLIAYKPDTAYFTDISLGVYVTMSSSSSLSSVNFPTLGKYLNLHSANEPELALQNRLHMSPEKTQTITIGRCRDTVIQPVLGDIRGTLRVVLSCASTSSDQSFSAHSSHSAHTYSDWSNTVGVLASDAKSVWLAKEESLWLHVKPKIAHIHSDEINLAPGTSTDSIRLAVVNKFGNPVWSSNDFLFCFQLKSDSSQHNPSL